MIGAPNRIVFQFVIIGNQRSADDIGMPSDVLGGTMTDNISS